MKEIKDLQKLIEERAEEKLDKDLNDLFQPIRESRLMNDIPEEFNLYIRTTGTPHVGTDPNRFFHRAGDYQKALHAFWLPTYIEWESRALLEKIDQITSDVQELLNFKKEDDY